MSRTASGGGSAAAAVDIGGTKISVAAVSQHGTLFGLVTRPSRGVTPDRALELIVEDLGNAAREANSAGLTITTLGIGATGRHDQQAGTLGAIDAVLPGLGGSDLPRRLASKLSLPLGALVNDADAAAAAEARAGAGRAADPAVVVTLGTGIGVAVLRGGQLVSGADGAHGEFGHITIALDGPPCMCGANGCWESLAGGGAIERAWMSSEREGGAPDKTQHSAAEIFDLANSGNHAAQTIVGRAVRATALGIANIAIALAPEVIVIGGGLAARWSRYESHVSAEIRRRAPIMSVAPRVVLATFGPHAVLTGAGMLALDLTAADTVVTK